MAQQGQKEDNGDDFLYAVGGIFLVILMISYFFGEEIRYAMIFVRYYEASFLNLFIPYDSLDTYIQAMSAHLNGNYTLNSKQIGIINNFVALCLIPVYVLVILFFVLRLYRSPKFKEFNKIHSMKTLSESQEKLWPWIAPINNLNLIDRPLYKGKWAMAKSVKNFVMDYNLLDDDYEVDTNRANKLFYSQLGRLWTGIDDLKNYEKALFACFIAHGNDDKKGAIDGLSKLSWGMLNKTIDFDWVDELIEKHIQDKRVQDIITGHAYVSTVMYSALNYSRRTGPLPASFFTWLRPTNRYLWLSLNNVGRKVAFCEIAGIYAHWLCEITSGHALEKPCVDEAVDGLKVALRGVKLT